MRRECCARVYAFLSLGEWFGRDENAARRNARKTGESCWRNWRNETRQALSSAEMRVCASLPRLFPSTCALLHANTHRNGLLPSAKSECVLTRDISEDQISHMEHSHTLREGANVCAGESKAPFRLVSSIRRRDIKIYALCKAVFRGFMKSVRELQKSRRLAERGM